jgi:iron complex transport system substrate-binding protein
MLLKTSIQLNLKRICQQILFCGLVAALVIACNSSPPPTPSASADCRMVDHAAGSTCVPKNPERVVVLGVATIGNTLALGVKPVGTILYFDKNNPPPYLAGKLEGVEIVGTGNQPNLETIAILKPDLIIMMYPDQGSYDQLAQIAPTVADDWFGFDDWKDHFNFVANVLGKTEKSEQVWAHYEQRIQKLRETLGDRYQDVEISVIRVCCNNLASDVKNSFSGTIIDDVGLRRPPAQDSVRGGLVVFSEELITEKLNGDIIFAIVDDDDDSERFFAQLQQNPLWNQLKAVQEGKVYPVNLATWRGGSPLAADAVVDDLFKYLVEES